MISVAGSGPLCSESMTMCQMLNVLFQLYNSVLLLSVSKVALLFQVSRAKLPYPCSICGKGFSYRETRDRHRKAFHFGIYSFMCQFCGRGFYDNVALKGHLSQHTGERAYSCVSCGAKFSYRSTLTRHLKKLHKKNENV